MRFERRFRVRAPRSRVAEFHRRADSLRAITPPLVPMRLGPVPEVLRPGDEFSFVLWLGPLPLRWRARIEEHPGGFADAQVEGPFASWRHRHEFVEVDAQTTEVRDRIDARLRRHPFWALVGLKMWLGLPLLFAYRRWKSRRLLSA